MDILIRYLHFLSILFLFGTLLAENILIGKTLARREIGRLAAVDAVFGISAATTLIAGLLLWFKYGKGAEFYLKNPVFHAKLGLFLAVGLLSIYPTVWFIKKRKGAPEERLEVPGRLIGILRLELGPGAVDPAAGRAHGQGRGLGLGQADCHRQSANGLKSC